MGEEGGQKHFCCCPVGSPDLDQVALLCLLLPGSKISQSFKLAHFDAPQLKRGGREKRETNKEKLWWPARKGWERGARECEG